MLFSRICEDTVARALNALWYRSVSAAPLSFVLRGAATNRLAYVNFRELL